MSTDRQSTGPGWLAAARDLGSFVVGWVVILKQAGIGFPPPAEVNIPLLILAACSINVPQAAWLLSGRQRGDTTGGSSDGLPPSRLPPSAPSLPTSPSVAGE